MLTDHEELFASVNSHDKSIPNMNIPNGSTVI